MTKKKTAKKAVKPKTVEVEVVVPGKKHKHKINVQIPLPPRLALPIKLHEPEWAVCNCGEKECTGWQPREFGSLVYTLISKNGKNEYLYLGRGEAAFVVHDAQQKAVEIIKSIATATMQNTDSGADAIQLKKDDEAQTIIDASIEWMKSTGNKA